LNISKKILFIAYFYPPTGSQGIPASQRIVKFVRHLKLKEIHVLSLKPEKYPGNNKTNSGIKVPVNGEFIHRTGEIDLFQWLTGIKRFFRRTKNLSDAVKTDPSNQNKHISHYQKFKDAISYLITFPDFASSWLIPAFLNGLNIIRKHKIDIIFATGMPWTSFLIGYFLKLFAGKKLIIDFRDPWVNNPYIHKSNFQKSFDKKWEKAVIRKADLIIANTNFLRHDLISRYLYVKDKIIHLPNGYDEDDFSSIRIRKNTNDNLILTHAGFMYGRRDPLPILNAIEHLLKTNPQISSKIQFQQIGNVNLNYNLIEMIQAKGLRKNITLIDQLEYQQCLSLLARSDVLLIIQQGTKNQIPSKLYEYIFLEKPIITIAEQESELRQIILQNDFSRVFEAKDVSAIADYIIQLYQLKIEGKLIDFQYPNKEKFNIKNINTILQQEMEKLISSKKKKYPKLKYET